MYTEWLRLSNPETGGKADLAAFFFRRCYDLIPHASTVGLIATNSISQGDSRKSSLMYICEHGGNIIFARRRVRWPGKAAVIASSVVIRKGVAAPQALLDGRSVLAISSFLIEAATAWEPRSLFSNSSRAFLGLKPGNTAAFVLTAEERNMFIERDASLADDLRPYIGGSDMNEDARLFGSRYIIAIGDVGVDSLPAHASAVRLLRERLEAGGQNSAEGEWWRYSRPAAALNAVLESGSLARVLVKAESSDTFAFAWLPVSCVFSNMSVVFTCDDSRFFSIVQSRVHEVWVRMTSSTFKDDLRYVARDGFETFAFPLEWQQDQSLQENGDQYYEFRAALMLRNNEGLTKTYNRFHDPDETSPDILRLRTLHAAMDRAVLEAYGWHDLAARVTCEFQLDYEEPKDEDDEAPSKRKKKKPWRYKWPQELHDEVLARLLVLNQQYAEQERLAGEAAQAAAPSPKNTKKTEGKKPTKKKTASKKKSSKPKAGSKQIALPGSDD